MKEQLFKVISLGVFVSLLAFSEVTFASIEDKDPIKDTQTRAVPVTQELLTREGEPGPASPTYKMQGETSKFLVKKPYDQVEKQYLNGD